MKDRRNGVSSKPNGALAPKLDLLKKRTFVSLIEKIVIDFDNITERKVPRKTFTELLNTIKELPQRFHDK